MSKTVSITEDLTEQGAAQPRRRVPATFSTSLQKAAFLTSISFVGIRAGHRGNAQQIAPQQAGQHRALHRGVPR